MADATFSLLLKVDGAQQGAQDVNRVRDALEGVQAKLGAGAAAQQAYGQASSQMGAAQQQTALLFSASGQALTDNDLKAAKYSETSNAATAAIKGAVAPTVDWTNTLKQLGINTQETSGHAKNFHTEMSHGAGLIRNFLDTAIGPLLPGLGGVTGSFRGLARETSGFSVAATAAIGGGLALVAIAAAIVGEWKAVADAEIAANVAIKELDFGAAETKLKASLQALDTYQATLDLSADSSVKFAARASESFTILKDAALKDFPAMVMAAGKSFDALWRSVGQGADVNKASTAQLEAQRAVLANLKATAETPTDLTRIGEQEAKIDRDRAGYAADDITRTRQVMFEKIAAAASVASAGGNEALAIKLRQDAIAYAANTAQLSAAERIKGEAAATAAIRESQKAAADMAAKEIEDAGKLDEIKGASAMKAAEFAAKEIEDRQRVVQADAQFFGTSIRHLDEYQAARRAAIVEEGQLALQNLDKQREYARAAAEARMQGLTGSALADALRKNEVDEAAYQAKRQELSGQTAAKLREDDAKVTEERRANYARNVNLAEQEYQQLAAMGQEDVAAHIRWAQQRATDENLGKTDQMKYEKEAFDERRKLEQDSFALSKALGLTNEVDVLNHVAAETSRYAEGSMQRIKAETDWATEAKRLRNEVADIGKSQLEKIVDELKAEGNEYVTLGMVMQRWSQDLGMAQGAMSALAAGGAADITALKLALDLGPTMGALTDKGVSGFQAIGASVQKAMEQLFGVRDTAVGATLDLSALGVTGAASVDRIRAALDAIRGAAPPGGLIPGLVDPGLLDMPRVWTGAWRSAGAAGAAAMADTGAAAARARARETAALADLAGDAQTLGETERTAATETTTAWQQGALARADAVVASFGRSSDSADDFQKHGLEVAGAVSASFGRMVPPDSPYRDLDLSALEFQRHALDTADGVVASFGRMNDSAVYGLPGLRGMDDALDLMGSSADMSTQRVNAALDSVSDRLRDLGTAGGGSVDAIDTSFNQLQDSLNTIGGSLGAGFKGALDDTLSYVDDYWKTMNDKIVAGASTTADSVYMTLSDRIRDTLDAEARAS